jgi:hypothetical protein
VTHWLKISDCVAALQLQMLANKLNSDSIDGDGVAWTASRPRMSIREILTKVSASSVKTGIRSRKTLAPLWDAGITAAKWYMPDGATLFAMF